MLFITKTVRDKLILGKLIHKFHAALEVGIKLVIIRMRVEVLDWADLEI